MKKQRWKTYAFWLLFSEAVGGFSGWLTQEGSKIYNETIIQPAFSPPGIVFPIVWGILFGLMGIGTARIYLTPESRKRSQSLRLFLIQLTFNFFWSIIFFNFRNFGFALIWLIVLWGFILKMILSFRKIDRLAARLQIPYLIWVTFAVYLNFAVWRLNG